MAKWLLIYNGSKDKGLEILNKGNTLTGDQYLKSIKASTPILYFLFRPKVVKKES